MMAEFVVRVSDEDVAQLQELVGESLHYYSDSVEGVLEQLAHAAADGIRRPRAWERDWVTQATGWPLR
jgi:hypothetical protein